MSLKPVMSVVYHATNHMLHALRGGPCVDASGGSNCNTTPTVAETGGEELWAFVPYDQLQKLTERMKPQSRDPHTYMLATPVRFADVFVPIGGGGWSRSVSGTNISGDGLWRVVILFGRGIGGKYLTALDVTAPGPFTTSSLRTAAPIPLWSRGNPDTNDGASGGTDNNSAASTDKAKFTRMGQTWSTPAIAHVNPANNTTARTSGGVEFVAYAGSGFGSGSNAAAEGTTFYTLDMLTGDIVNDVDVGDRTPAPAYENAIVAGPSVFNPLQLKKLATSTLALPPGADYSITLSTRVYFPDVHGRIWRVLTDAPGTSLLFGDVGVNQPISNPVALLNYAGSGTTDRPHIFAEAGNDNRVTPPPANTPPFKMFALRDDDLASDADTADGVDGPAKVLFTLDFPNGFRGTVQPATAFTGSDPPLGRVFFAGNRFNLPATANAPTPPPCVSSFDAILFAVGAESGNAAYDLNSSDGRSVTKIGQRVQAVRVAQGRLVVDTGLSADIAPPPPAPPVILPAAAAPLGNVLYGASPTSPLWGQYQAGQFSMNFKTSSSVCK